MSRILDDLRRRMDAACAALDFEEAGRLRDQMSVLRGRPEEDASPEIDTSRLRRQVPGAMGLGTSDQAMVPPPGWTPPKRPDALTKVRRPARRRARRD